MRYIILVILTLPIIFLALVNLITRYKLKKIDSRKFRYQLLIWIIISVVLISSFPVYNLIVGKPLLDSKELSLFDIVQTAAIVVLIYIVNNQRQKIESVDKRLRDLHQELSINLSKKD